MVIRDVHKNADYLLVTFAVQGMGVLVGVCNMTAPENEQLPPKVVKPRTENQFYHTIASKQRLSFDMVFMFSKTEQGVPSMSGLARTFGMLSPSFEPGQIVAEDMTPNTVIKDLFGQLIEKSEHVDSKIVQLPGTKMTVGERFKFVIDGQVVEPK